MPEHCIFCQILSGQAPAFKVWEDESTLAFMDIFPAGDGHVLVVPKVHAANLFDLPEEALIGVAKVSRKLAIAIRQALAPDGLMVAQLNGSAAGQTVFHYHQHLIPRRQGDPMSLRSKGRGDDEKLKRQAAAIAALLR